MQRAAAPTTSSTLPAGTTPRQARPAAGRRHGRRAACSLPCELARGVTAEHQPTPSHGARRRGRARATRSARHRCGASARPRAGARRRTGPAAQHQPPRATATAVAGASDQSVIHMRRPPPQREAAECREARLSYAPSLRFPPARRLPGAQCGLLAQEPAPGRPASASGATTGGTGCITRLSVSSAFESRLHSRSQAPRRRPLQRCPLGCLARGHPSPARAAQASAPPSEAGAHDRGLDVARRPMRLVVTDVAVHAAAEAWHPRCSSPDFVRRQPPARMRSGPRIKCTIDAQDSGDSSPRGIAHHLLRISGELCERADSLAGTLAHFTRRPSGKRSHKWVRALELLHQYRKQALLILVCGSNRDGHAHIVAAAASRCRPRPAP